MFLIVDNPSSSGRPSQRKLILPNLNPTPLTHYVLLLGRPSQRELWLFAIMMLWEYYSMIYIRSANSILLFPRASLALFLLYHFYLFSHPSGFHLLALLVLFLFLTALMIYCVRKFEFEAYHRGLVNIDQPRGRLTPLHSIL